MAHAEEIAPRRPTPEEFCRSTGRDRGHARPLSDSVLTPDRILNVAWANSFFALAREVQEQLEDVDEVQVERECPEHGELLLRFGDNNSWRNNDPLDRVLGYIDFRKSILRGEAAEFTCL